MKYILLFLIIFILGIVMFFKINQTKTQTSNDPSVIRYVAIGDSYTIGDDVPEDARWPNLLVKELQNKGIHMQLVANPSVTGWTTQQVIDNELSIYDDANPQFATLLIGVNDWVQGVSTDDFRENVSTILDHMEARLTNKHNLIVVTIPDFSATPTGKEYANGRDISAGIVQFNSILKEEAKKRDLPVVDIYPLTQQMEGHPELINPDGLHPSAKEYQFWEKLIFPVALNLLKR